MTPIAADHSTDEGRAKILEACPEPDILVGTCSPPAVTGDYSVIEPDDWYDTLAITLISPVEFMRATVDGMIERGWGRIVNIGTVAAKHPTEVRMLSGAPRAALVNYTAALARKVARHNVVINNLCPGMFGTDRLLDPMRAQADASGQSMDEVAANFTAQIPAGRFGEPYEFGAMCAFLCSQYVGYMAGQNVLMDGGQVNVTI